MKQNAYHIFNNAYYDCNYPFSAYPMLCQCTVSTVLFASVQLEIFYTVN